MDTVSIQDLKPKLSSVLAEVESGSTILITRHGRPVARIAPVDPPYVHRGDLVGQPWPPAITTGLGPMIMAALEEDRGDR